MGNSYEITSMSVIPDRPSHYDGPFHEGEEALGLAHVDRFPNTELHPHSYGARIHLLAFEAVSARIVGCRSPNQGP
jgi:hypothetical protein